jgi:hypothetical protein
MIVTRKLWVNTSTVFNPCSLLLYYIIDDSSHMRLQDGSSELTLRNKIAALDHTSRVNIRSKLHTSSISQKRLRGDGAQSNLSECIFVFFGGGGGGVLKWPRSAVDDAPLTLDGLMDKNGVAFG